LKQKTQPCPAIEYRGACGDGDKPPPCSVNQFRDEDPSKQCLTISFDPWVTGKTTYSPKDGLTGLRPVADRYSITNRGPDKWWAHNLNIFEQSKEKIRDAQYVSQENYAYNPRLFKNSIFSNDIMGCERRLLP